MTTYFRAAVLTNYFAVAKELGLNTQPLLRNVGLSKKILENRDQPISSTAVVKLLETSAQETGCASFGLRMAELRKLTDIGELSLLLTHQQTMRDALLVTVQYRHLLNRSLEISVEDVDTTVVIREEIITETPVPARQATELAIGVLFRTCGAIMGKQWQPRSINFAHEAPADLQMHKRFFRCPVRFAGDFNGIVCNAAELDAPNPMADSALASYAQSFIETLPGSVESTAAHEVRKAIYLLLPVERASIEQISIALGMNVRTLQRRLEDEGEHFTDLINGVRRDLAVRYLENPRYSLLQISELLGYSAPNSFTRWFNSQFGVVPTEWRTRKGIKTQSKDPIRLR